MAFTKVIRNGTWRSLVGKPSPSTIHEITPNALAWQKDADQRSREPGASHRLVIGVTIGLAVAGVLWLMLALLLRILLRRFA